jgi:O-antigen/teichoic acid export membrane protein
MTLIENEEKKIVDKTVTNPLLAGGWASATYIISIILLAVVFIPLVALVSREEYGLYTLANVFASGIVIIVDISLVRSMVRTEGDLEEIAQAGFWLSIVVGFVGMVLCALLGIPLAFFYNTPEVLPIMLMLAPAVLAAGLGAVPNAILARELDFRRKIIPDVGSSFLAAGLAIGLAIMGAGVYSLIAFVLAKPISGATIAWIVVGWRPKRRKPDWATFKRLLNFALPVSGGEILLYVRFNVDFLVVGRTLGTGVLGVYNLAWSISDRPAHLINSFFKDVGYASFSHLQVAREQLLNLFLSATRLIASLTLPVYLVAIIVRSDLILGLLGTKWADTIEPLLPLFVLQVFWVVSYPSVSLILALGHSRLYAICNGASLVATIAAVIIGSSFGISGVAWGMLIAVGTFSSFWLVLATIFLRLNWQHLAYILAVPAVLCLTTVPAAFIAQQVAANMSSLIRLILEVGVAGLVMLATIWFCRKQLWQDVLSLKAKLPDTVQEE